MADSETMLRAIQCAISKAAGEHGVSTTAYTVLDPPITLAAEILAQGPEGMREGFIERFDIAITLQWAAGSRFMQRQ
jgi:hypothetical protein